MITPPMPAKSGNPKLPRESRPNWILETVWLC
jgi:hypothetical protein